MARAPPISEAISLAYNAEEHSRVSVISMAHAPESVAINRLHFLAPVFRTNFLSLSGTCVMGLSMDVARCVACVRASLVG